MTRTRHLGIALAIAICGSLIGSRTIAQTSAIPLFLEGEPSKPTPFVVGGVKLDIDRLVVSQAPIRRRGPLVTGTADHAGTARIAREMRIDSRIPDDIVQPGAVVHRVEFANPGPNGTTALVTWCGTLGRSNLFGGPASMVCFVEGDPLHQAFIPMSTQAWLNNTQAVSRYGIVTADHFDIVPSEIDLIGPMEVRFNLHRVTRRDITIRLIARRGDSEVLVMTMKRPVTDGKATIPLWDHRLELSVAGDTVTPAILPGGDGFGPPEFGTYY